MPHYRLIYTAGDVQGKFTVHAASSPEEATSRIRTYLAQCLAYRDLFAVMIPNEVTYEEENLPLQVTH